MRKRDKDFDRRIFKKSGDELQEYLAFKRRGSRVENKKGKGSYKRKPKHRNQDIFLHRKGLTR